MTLKRKNRQLYWAVIQKTRILQCFSFGLEGFCQDLEFGFFRTWTVFFGLGFRTRPLVSLRTGFRTRPLVSLRIGSVILSDWMYQKYKDRASGESEGTLDFIVSLRIVYLHKPHKW